jgi:ABC-type glutathione transport system ATPase component
VTAGPGSSRSADVPVPGALADPLLSVRRLTKYFPVRTGIFGRATGQVRAVDGVSLDVGHAETLGVVGESGCGKTTLGRTILRLVEPTGGEIRFDGVDMLSLAGKSLRSMRRNMQIIFQDPFSSLNPRMTIGATVREGLTVHRIAEGAAADQRVRQLRVQVPARILRWPATTGRHRPRTRRRAEVHRL